MTDRINLDVAADAFHDAGCQLGAACTHHGPRNRPISTMRAALDAIHPALAELTPDDVTAIFTGHLVRMNAHSSTAQGRVHDILQAAWEASRD